MIANTKQGQVQGIDKLGCLQFRGIPFAAPPTGELRWVAPQPPASWEGVRDATEFGPICPQVAGTMEALGGGQSPVDAPPQDEDCLTLNVFTPATDGSRPVMVWIHGGAFSTGSGRIPWYSGHNFARDDVVLVTINYRVNAFGFLHLDDLFDGLNGTGALGIADQVAALAWVRDNIANFGGDPDNVTIFGESAGGMSVGTLLATPSAKGLFHKAIPQSGACNASLARDVATRIAEHFCELAGVKPGDLDGLRSLSTEEIVKAVENLGVSLQTGDGGAFGDDFAGFAMAAQPVYGTDLIPTQPLEAVRAGSAAGIPVLVGTTLEEWKLFSVATPDEGFATKAVRPLRNLAARAGRSADEIVDAYESHLGSDATPRDLRNALETDRNFRMPAVALAEALVENGSPTWMYRFDFRSPAFGGRLGACHALEIPFVFDNLDAPGVNMLTGNDAPQSLATAAHAAWVAFAKTGDPTTDTLAWPAFDTDRRATALLDAEVRVVDDPDRELREVWAGLY